MCLSRYLAIWLWLFGMIIEEAINIALSALHFHRTFYIIYLLLIFISLPAFANKPANRIISLAPDLTEIIYAAGAGTKLVGVSTHSDYPLQAKNLPVIADYNHLDVERILALHPDLIISETFVATGQQLQLLQSAHIKVVIIHLKQLSDIARAIRMIGHYAGTEKQADMAANTFMQKLKVLRQHHQNKKLIKVFYVLQSSPLLTINRHTMINQVIQLCGGTNIFAASISSAPEVTFEAVIAANPDIIFYPQPEQRAISRLFKPWPQISAVAKQHVFAIDPNLLNRASPRILLGAEQMCILMS